MAPPRWAARMASVARLQVTVPGSASASLDGQLRAAPAARPRAPFVKRRWCRAPTATSMASPAKAASMTGALIFNVQQRGRVHHADRMHAAMGPATTAATRERRRCRTTMATSSAPPPPAARTGWEPCSSSATCCRAEGGRRRGRAHQHQGHQRHVEWHGEHAGHGGTFLVRTAAPRPITANACRSRREHAAGQRLGGPWSGAPTVAGLLPDTDYHHRIVAHQWRRHHRGGRHQLPHRPSPKILDQPRRCAGRPWLRPPASRARSSGTLRARLSPTPGSRTAAWARRSGAAGRCTESEKVALSARRLVCGACHQGPDSVLSSAARLGVIHRQLQRETRRKGWMITSNVPKPVSPAGALSFQWETRRMTMAGSAVPPTAKLVITAATDADDGDYLAR